MNVWCYDCVVNLPAADLLLEKQKYPRKNELYGNGQAKPVPKIVKVQKTVTKTCAQIVNSSLKLQAKTNNKSQSENVSKIEKKKDAQNKELTGEPHGQKTRKKPLGMNINLGHDDSISKDKMRKTKGSKNSGRVDGDAAAKDDINDKMRKKK